MDLECGNELATLPDSQNEDGISSTKLESKAAASTTQQTEIKHVSEDIPLNKVTSSTLIFGFLGIGKMGSNIVKHLLRTGHNVYIWNRHLQTCEELKELGAKVLPTPQDVASTADIIFSCVSNAEAAREILYGMDGVVLSLENNKGYVEMTSMSVSDSHDIREAIVSCGGRYLEVRLQGDIKKASQGSLTIIASGDETLYNDCCSCFNSFGKKSMYLGNEIGAATKMYLATRLLEGVALTAASEAMTLANSLGLELDGLIKVFRLSPIGCPLVVDNCEKAYHQNYETDSTLGYLQKDLNLALGLGDTSGQHLTLSAAANELFKYTKSLSDIPNTDVSAIFPAARNEIRLQ